MRILHLPDLVGGHPSALSAGENLLGAWSETLSFSTSPFGYRADRVLENQDRGALRRWAERLSTFLEVRGAYDVFHFNFGSSLLNPHSGIAPLADLPFYPVSAKKFMTFQGSDSRLDYGETLQASIEAEIDAGNRSTVDAFLEMHQKRRALREAVIEKSAKHCNMIFVLNPDLLQFMPEDKARFLPYAIEDVSPLVGDPGSRNQEKKEQVHIVHLSTNRLLKGTGLIERGLDLLAKELPITYEIVFRQSRNQAIQAMARADIVVDQLVLGWYGATAVEAMYLGKPVMGYIDNKQLEAVPCEFKDDLPIVRTGPGSIANDIAELVHDEAKRTQLGERGRAYAKCRHSAPNVADLVLRAYTM